MKYAGRFLCGFVLGAAALLLLLMSLASGSPPTPNLKPPESIAVLLHPPWITSVTARTVMIPTESQDDVFRRLVPETYYGDIIGDFPPVVAEATVTHADETQTRVLVREGGKNPALVSIDGIHYFYARSDPEVFAGATELIRLIRDINYRLQDQVKTE